MNLKVKGSLDASLEESDLNTRLSGGVLYAACLYPDDCGIA